MQRNTRKQQNGKDQGSLQAHWRYQGTISSNLTKPKRLRRGGKNTQKNYTKKKKKECNDQDNHDIRHINKYNKIETN